MSSTNQLSEIEMTIKTEPYLKIKGGVPLKGEVALVGAKNAALPAIVAACLSDEKVKLRNVPLGLNDVKLIIQLLKDMGASIQVNENQKEIICSGKEWTGGILDFESAGKIRHSLLLLGLSASKKAKLFLPLPGGCELGERKHDMHVTALSLLGNVVTEDEGILLKPDVLSGDVTVEFYYPTFGGTLNAIFASVTLEGKNITINNAARNPEVIDTIELLSKMGAKISWLDENTLFIEGVSRLKGTDFSVMPDRIIAATVIAATGLTKGNVKLLNFDGELLKSEIEVWQQTGMTIEQDNNDLYINGENDLLAKDVTTSAYPGFHTDIQPLHTLLMTLSKGQSVIKETILDGRFRYTSELNKMGAKINVEQGDFYCVNGARGQIAIVDGVKNLHGTVVKATDIRGGAAVAVAGLAAEGITKVTNLYQLERGYGEFVELFSSLGANVKRVSELK